jgi:hypothetical protein
MDLILMRVSVFLELKMNGRLGGEGFEKVALGLQWWFGIGNGRR